MKITTIIAFVLAIIGGINWLLVGTFDFNLVSVIFGSMSVVTRIIYSLVGISALWLIFYLIVYMPLKNM